MEAIVRNVRDIDDTDRRALEHFIGQQLRENQQVLIQVISVAPNAPPAAPAENDVGQAQLPSWCQVYDGLSEEEVAEVEGVVLKRAELKRPS